MKVKFIDTPFIIHTYWTIDMENHDCTKQFAIMASHANTDELEDNMHIGVHV